MVDGHIIELNFLPAVRTMASETIVYISSVHAVGCLMLSAVNLLFVLPVDTSEACGQFVSFLLMMGDACATYSVPRTILCARAVYDVVRAGHIIYCLFGSKNSFLQLPFVAQKIYNLAHFAESGRNRLQSDHHTPLTL